MTTDHPTLVQRPRVVSVKSYMTLARDQGLSTVDAVEELIDNAIDAGATHIDIRVSKPGKHIRLSVEDDGHGIPPVIVGADKEPYDGIGYCLSLGGRGPKMMPAASIGKFGAGLTNAAMCQSLRTEVYSKTAKDKATRWNYLDIQQLEESEDLQLPEMKAKEPASDIAPDWSTHPTGTLVVFEKVDNPDYKDPKNLADVLYEHLGMVYRRFLNGRLTIRINDETVEPYDPLFLTPGGYDTYDPATTQPDEKGFLPDAVPLANQSNVRFDDTIMIDDGNGKRCPVHVKVVMLDVAAIRSRKGWNGKWMNAHGLNERSQGFYIMRSNRQISTSRTFKLFTRNADLNYMRGLIDFPVELDKAFGVQVVKGRVNPKDHVVEALKTALGKTLGHIQKDTRKAIEKVVDATGAENAKAKGPSLGEDIGKAAAPMMPSAIKPDAEEIQAQAKVIEATKEQIKTIEEDPDLQPHEIKQKVAPLKAEVARAAYPFVTRFESLYDPVFYEPRRVGMQTQVVINDKHPFFKVFERATQRPEERALMELLLFSAAHAELQYDDEEMLAKLEAFRMEWSKYLKIMLTVGGDKVSGTAADLSADFVPVVE